MARVQILNAAPFFLQKDHPPPMLECFHKVIVTARVIKGILEQELQYELLSPELATEGCIVEVGHLLNELCSPWWEYWNGLYLERGIREFHFRKNWFRIVD